VPSRAQRANENSVVARATKRRAVEVAVAVKKAVRVWRQDSATSPGRWEVFAVTVGENDTLLAALQAINRNPVTEDGTKSTAVVYTGGLANGDSGEQAVLLNGQPCLPSRTSLAGSSSTLVVSPLTRYPVVRDLAVDLSSAAASWVEILGRSSTGPGASPCLGCGACLEVCPSAGPSRAFVGAHLLAEVERRHAEPGHSERMRAMLGPRGLALCDNAQACVEVCPQELPLDTAIGSLKRRAAKRWLHILFSE
jgi:succinate dehydrogenase / fumarate reductase iron-sulfur subunit